MDRIGEYSVRRLLGEGGMGKVYEAEERLTGRRVALKVMRAELAKNDDARRWFQSEMKVTSRLEHPNVVRSLAAFEADGQLVLALEYLEGQTLRDLLNERGRLTWPEAVEIAAQTAQALAAAHATVPAIIHRDLKPENVMLVSVGETESTESSRSAPKIAVKVMDFGIAKVLETARATNTQSLGTLQYMSPEQIDALPVDGRSDLYALGLLLYEMLEGGGPFQSTSPRELLNLQCTAPAPELSDEARRSLPAGVRDLMFLLLEKSPNDRPESAAEVVRRLAPLRIEEANTRRPRAAESAGDRASKEPTETTKDRLRTTGAPRTDTVALLENNRAARGMASRLSRELPTRFALTLVGALSMATFATTYVLRWHSANTQQVEATAHSTSTTTTAARSDL